MKIIGKKKITEQRRKTEKKIVQTRNESQEKKILLAIKKKIYIFSLL